VLRAEAEVEEEEAKAEWLRTEAEPGEEV